jgi:hypothetical protein
MSRPDFSARTAAAAPASLPTGEASLVPASEKARGSPPKRRGGSGRNGRSKIESDCCESGKAGGDEDAPGRRPRSGDNADGVSCGGCDVGLT